MRTEYMAGRCVDLMKVSQTLLHFNNILGALSKQASPGEVQIWVTRMRDAGIRPDTWACNILLKSMLQAGEWSSAATLLSGMTSEHASTMTAAAAGGKSAETWTRKEFGPHGVSTIVEVSGVATARSEARKATAPAGKSCSARL